MNNISFLGFSDPVSSWSHLITAVLFLLGAFPLIAKSRGNGPRLASQLVYSFSLVFLFSMSGMFHWLERETAARMVLQRLDHAAIWILIAGTFTPMHTILFRSFWRWGMLLLIWAIAITGLVLEVVFFESFPEWLIVTLFLALGWMGAFSHMRFKKMYPGHSPRLIVLGGAFYSIGAAIDFLRMPVIIPQLLGPHEIFHLFVCAGAASHWLFIYNWANHPVPRRIYCELIEYARDRVLAHGRNEKISIIGNSHGDAEEKVLRELKSRIKSTYPFEIRFTQIEAKTLE